MFKCILKRYDKTIKEHVRTIIERDRLSAAMEEVVRLRENNDLSRYTPYEVEDVEDTEEK